MLPEENRKKELFQLARRLGVDSIDLHLLDQAFLHSSYINEIELSPGDGNERLEFLGDAVLGLIVTEALFLRFEDKQEGELSKVKSIVVSRKVLAEKALEIGLGRYILLGKGEELTGGRERNSILANTFESVVGAVFLSCSFDCVRQFVLRHLEEEIDKVVSGRGTRDHKSELQELVQKDSGKLPNYEVVDILGPDHDKLYEVRVTLNGDLIGSGEGKSKKSAEQAAARQALERLHIG